MKARPILFKPDMVRALLAGQKTQTRRILKLPKDCFWLYQEDGTWTDSNLDHGYWHVEELSCPYGDAPFEGNPGDLLWVRETFSGPHCMEATNELPALPPSRWPADCPIHYWADGNPFYGDWTRPRPSIHMPRHASRLTLEITDVRVERLQEISEEDADAECFGGNFPGEVLPDLFPGDPEQWSHLSITECFARLWESINGVGSWAANPWVWVIQFRAHHMNVDAFLRGREVA